MQKVLGAVTTVVWVNIRLVRMSWEGVNFGHWYFWVKTDFQGLDLDVVACQIEILENYNVGYPRFL